MTASDKMGHGIFVTGTDTNIGKTVITAALGLTIQDRGLTTGVMKPIETGVRDSHPDESDGYRLNHTIASQQSFDTVTQFQFRDPLAPLSAARQAKVSIELSTIRSAYQKLAQEYQYTLVEGIGGVMVPLNTQACIRDLIQLMGLPCIVIGRTSLGGVNHVQLTIEVLKNHQIDILAIVLNHGALNSDSRDDARQRESTKDLIRELNHIPVFGPLACEEDFLISWENGVRKLQRQTPIQELTDYLLTQMPR